MFTQGTSCTSATALLGLLIYLHCGIGNLLGTFHTLDSLDGEQELNCSLVGGHSPVTCDALHTRTQAGRLLMCFSPSSKIGPWHYDGPRHHCTLGLISKTGWAVVDDSQSPVLVEDWVERRLAGQCGPEVSCLLCSVPGSGTGDSLGGLVLWLGSACGSARHRARVCEWSPTMGNSSCLASHVPPFPSQRHRRAVSPATPSTIPPRR